MNKVLEKNFKKHCKIALLSYLSKIDCKNAKNQQILGFVFPRRKKAILKLLLRELKTKIDSVIQLFSNSDFAMIFFPDQSLFVFC